jgi:hypothetical protein
MEQKYSKVSLLNSPGSLIATLNPFVPVENFSFAGLNSLNFVQDRCHKDTTKLRSEAFSRLSTFLRIDAPSLTSVRAVFEIKNTGAGQVTPLRWKEWLNDPYFADSTTHISPIQRPKHLRRRCPSISQLRDDKGRQSLDAGAPGAFRRIADAPHGASLVNFP